VLATAVGEDAVDPTGLAIVSKIVQARPTSEEQAERFTRAMRQAAENPEDVGYPWIDPVSGELPSD
jgi:hypothetical protein